MANAITARELLDDLMAQIEATDPEMMAPKFELEKGDKVVGIITDELTKKVFSLSAFYRREGKRIQVDLEATGSEDQEVMRELSKYKQKHDTLQEIFWLLIRTQFDLWNQDCGIRDLWQVVETSGKGQANATIIKAQLPRFLRDLLEGQE
jgi:hypothetical protein